jgi:hypothetical protein
VNRRKRRRRRKKNKNQEEEEEEYLTLFMKAHVTTSMLDGKVSHIENTVRAWCLNFLWKRHP